jgi:putative transcriptional regulator
MPNYHPDQFLLNDYVAGNLPGSIALAVGVHLDFCAQCRAERAQLEQLGAQFFSELDPVPVSDDALTQLMQRLEGRGAVPVDAPALRSVASHLPRSLRSLVPPDMEQLDWKRISASLRASRLGFGDPQREVALHHIRAGGKVVSHGHGGNEFTVVLQGRFSDQDGSYAVGDFLQRGPEHVHRPVADPDCDCLCLAVLDAPIRLSGLFGRLANPFLRIHPR